MRISSTMRNRRAQNLSAFLGEADTMDISQGQTFQPVAWLAPPKVPNPPAYYMESPSNPAPDSAAITSANNAAAAIAQGIALQNAAQQAAQQAAAQQTAQNNAAAVAAQNAARIAAQQAIDAANAQAAAARTASEIAAAQAAVNAANQHAATVGFGGGESTLDLSSGGSLINPGATVNVGGYDVPKTALYIAGAALAVYLLRR